MNRTSNYNNGGGGGTSGHQQRYQPKIIQKTHKTTTNKILKINKCLYVSFINIFE